MLRMNSVLVLLLTFTVLGLSSFACAPSPLPSEDARVAEASPIVEEEASAGEVRAPESADVALDEPQVEPEQTPQPFSTFTNSIGMEFVLLPAGTFLMGSPTDEIGRTPMETQHKVTLTRPFYIGITEVTQPQYEAVMGVNPSRFLGDRTPVQNVSWYDAVAFCEKLSEMEGRRYRLPTEAEWEYACRAGTTTPFAFGETISAEDDNFNAQVIYGPGERGIYRARPIAADGMRPNNWGIISMHGNVQEWCSDWHDADYYRKSPGVDPTGPETGRLKVLRGGSYLSHPQFCRSAHRFGASPNHKFMSIGFRVVCEVLDVDEE